MFQKFILLKDLSSDQIQAILSHNDLYQKVSNTDLELLPDININNLLNICNFVDYYQLENSEYVEFIDNLRCLVYDQKIDIKNIPIHIQKKVYDHVCIYNMSCNKTNNTIKHIFCHKYLTKFKNVYYDLNDAIVDGSLEIVKYLFKINDTSCFFNAIDWACDLGYLDIVKYLFEVQNQHCTVIALERASKNGHFEVVKYLCESCNQNETKWPIELAKLNNHTQIVEYLLKKK